jgi:class 3 adenylate cyclase/lipopolysaccharide biosynthesis regulator YciM
MLRSRSILFFLFLLFIVDAHAQSSREQYIDSLKAALPKTDNDTDKVNIMTRLGSLYTNYDPAEGLKYSMPAVELAEKLQWKQGMAMAYNVLGSNYKDLSKYPRALKYYFKSLELSEALKDQKHIAATNGNIGKVYQRLNNYPKALEYYEKALKVNEAMGFKFGMTNNYSDIGVVYSESGDNDRALESFDKALKIAEENNDQEGVAIVLGNIGNVYSNMGRYDAAVKYFLRGKAINEVLGREVSVAISYSNLGDNYYKLDSTLKVQKKIPASATAMLDSAIYYYSKAAPIYKKLSALDYLAVTYQSLAAVYKDKKDYKNAFDAFDEFKKLQDSIFSNDKKVKLANLGAERAEFEKKQQVKLTKLAQTKRRNEAIMFAVVIILLSVFTFFVVKERRKSEKLLLNILPEEVAQELKKKGSADANHFDEVTVLFTDFVSFTTIAEKMHPQELVDELDTCFKAFDGIITKYGIEKIKTIGDAYMAASGLPVADPQHAVKMVSAALEIVAFIKARKLQKGELAFDIRVGLHSGTVVAGIVGVKKFAYDIWGDAVNTAARMEQKSEPGKINISQTTYDLVKDRFVCTYRGEIEAKNKGKLKMYFVEKALS